MKSEASCRCRRRRKRRRKRRKSSVGMMSGGGKEIEVARSELILMGASVVVVVEGDGVL